MSATEQQPELKPQDAIVQQEPQTQPHVQQDEDPSSIAPVSIPISASASASADVDTKNEETSAQPQSQPQEEQNFASIQSGGREISNNILYVGNIHFSVSDQTLQDLFTAVGNPFKSFKILQDKNKLGFHYAFVEYESTEFADQALQALDGTQLADNQLKITKAYQTQQVKNSDTFNLFIGDLSLEVDDELLNKAFQKFTSLVQANVMWDMKSGRSRGYGFVCFAEKSDAEEALQSMNGATLGDRQIRLNWASHRDRTSRNNSVVNHSNNHNNNHNNTHNNSNNNDYRNNTYHRNNNHQSYHHHNNRSGFVNGTNNFNNFNNNNNNNGNNYYNNPNNNNAGNQFYSNAPSNGAAYENNGSNNTNVDNMMNLINGTNPNASSNDNVLMNTTNNTANNANTPNSNVMYQGGGNKQMRNNNHNMMSMSPMDMNNQNNQNNNIVLNQSQPMMSPPSYEMVLRQTPNWLTVVYLGNLSEYTTQNDLIPLLQNFGYIVNFRLLPEKNCAFVTYDTHERAALAIVQLSGFSMNGRPLKCGWGKNARSPPNMRSMPYQGIRN
jgi:nucleolysin TIA-1/TIAR